MGVAIKLRREFQGQDSWGAFLEEVGVDEKGNLRYRQSNGGNCSFGSWPSSWSAEDDAFAFLLGPTNLSDDLKQQIREAIANLPTLSEFDMNRGFAGDEANYGGY